METLRLKIEELGSGNANYFGGKYTGGIHLMQVPKEISQCLKYLMESGKSINSYLEIGSAAGGTAYLFNKFFDIDTMVLIDDIGFEESNLRKDILADVNRSEFVGNSRSQEAFDFVNDFDCMFDVVFVDGDHTYEGVSADVITYSRFVTPGGYLILHDTVACVGVKRVFDGLKVSNNFTSVVEFVDYDHRYPMGIGVIKRHG